MSMASSSAGDAQRRQRDAEEVEQRMAEQRDDEQDAASNRHALDRHGAALPGIDAGRQRRIEQGNVQRTDGGEQGGEGEE